MSQGAVLFTRPVRRVLLALAVLVVLSFGVGFWWLPSVKPDFAQGSLWEAICRAAGVPSTWYAPLERNDAQASRFPVVPVPANFMGGDVGRGGTLALSCTMCHGARGVSASDVPNLAGQYGEVLYKQLLDYKFGQRSHALMQGLAQQLSDQDIRDLAAFYAQLPRPAAAAPDVAPPPLVTVGQPLRNIAPCASCHGGIDRKLGSPWLEGMPDAYLSAQLQAFAAGTRRNDAHAVMRNIARQMTPQEIQATAHFYSTRAIVGGARGTGQ